MPDVSYDSGGAAANSSFSSYITRTQATATIVAAYLDYSVRIQEHLTSDPSGTYRISPNELYAMIDEIQTRLQNPA